MKYILLVCLLTTIAFGQERFLTPDSSQNCPTFRNANADSSGFAVLLSSSDKGEAYKDHWIFFDLGDTVHANTPVVITLYGQQIGTDIDIAAIGHKDWGGFSWRWIFPPARGTDDKTILTLRCIAPFTYRYIGVGRFANRTAPYDNQSDAYIKKVSITPVPKVHQYSRGILQHIGQMEIADSRKYVIK